MSTIKSSTEHLTLNADGSGKEIRLQNNGTQNVILDSSGNVGIGQTSPSAQLHLKQTSGDQFLKMEGATTNWGWRNQSDGTYGLFDFTNSRWVTLGNSSSAWQFYVNGSEKARFTTDGLTFNGDTAAANALDDYEEGTYTVAITMGSGTASVDSSYQTLSYTKIGRLVTINGQFQVGSVSSPSGVFQISLPFTCASGSQTQFYAAGTYRAYNVNIPNDGEQNVCRTTPNEAYATLEWSRDNDVPTNESATENAFYMIGLTYTAA